MESLFDKWKTRVPNYGESHKSLFESLSQKFGAEGEKKISLGKHFSTNYELYTYAFFLGLYNKEYIPLIEKKVNFSHHIQHWGSKTTTSVRKDFTILQEYIFEALLVKSNIDLIALEKGELTEEDAVKQLMETLEAYTNGGLTLIQEKSDENPNIFLQPTSFLDLILGSKLG
ncbi:MAG: hypothetical protein K8R68_01140 [Bacteroidales bacterium]|nr:hypothetical protein [Bacteroidales bacterium]